MNRFKFRVWSIENKKLYYPDLIAISRIGAVRINIDTNFYPDKCVIQQFIDLQDSTGRDIYEGDIVEALSSDNRYLSKIVWCKNDSRFGAESINLRHNSKTISYNLSMGCSRWKIVGNIYENPELVALDKYKP